MWFTFSGGEPFLKRDLVELVQTAYNCCHPKVINIPTNGILAELIPTRVAAIAKSCPKSQIIINLSLDEIGERHDALRGVKNNYQLTRQTFQNLRALNLPNVTLGIHTVISKFNWERFSEIYQELQTLQPDSYITEIAEERAELQTIGSDITPGAAAYSEVVQYLMQQLQSTQFRGVSRLTQAFRAEYYQYVQKILDQPGFRLPCFAGIASAQITPNGEVWPCCIKAQSIGNLKTFEYDFKQLWISPQAQSIRNQIARERCFCPLANAAYTNLLLNWRSLWKVGLRFLFGTKSGSTR